MDMRQSKPMLLLIEDDTGDAGLIRMALTEGELACTIVQVRDGVEAVEYLRAAAESGGPVPDLVLLDLNMPKRSGHEVLTELKADAVLKVLPVVVLTTSEAERDVAAAYLAGAAGYFIKPLDVDVLFDSMRALKEYWFGAVRRPKLRPQVAGRR